MFSSKSIRSRFLLQLIFSSASLIFIFSSILYFYIEKSVYAEKREELIQYAKNIANNKSVFSNDNLTSDSFLNLSVEVIYLKKCTLVMI